MKKNLHYLKLTVLLFLCCHGVQATTVLQLDIDQLLQQAELVFEGQVISSEARWNDDQSSINTIIRFQVNDIIKGEFAEDVLELQFAGGTVGDMTLRISDMEYPAPGDQGIYFVEQLDHNQINPLLGWSQGHFRILKDSTDEERIYSSRRAPVQALAPAQSLSLRQRSAAFHQAPFSDGTVKGITAGQPNTEMQTGMKKNRFKDALRSKLQTLSESNVR